MYICPRANCAAEATTASRTVLHRSAGILVPVEASAGVVVGHFVEVVWTPAVGGTHDESRLRGKYIMCARTREVVKIYSSASESSGTLSIDRSVMVSDGVFLRDFIKVSIPPSHPPETVPGTFTVATRTTVLHTRADAPDVDGEASVEYDASSDLPPFALLEMSDQTAAEVAINPSYGFSGFGSYRMAFTQSLAGVNVAGDGVSTRPSLGLPWTPPAHCAVCPAPVWSLQKLNRKEAADLRGLFHKAYVEAPALRARVGRTMSLPGAGGALGGQRQAAENENRIDSLLQMSMTNRNSAPANLSLPVGQATAGGVSSSFVSASIPKARVLQSSHVQSALVPPSLSPTTLAQTALAPVQLSSPTLAPSPLATPSLAPGTLVQSPVAQGSHSQASLLRPAASPYSPLVPRMSPHVNLAPGDMADNRNFGVRQMLSSNTKPGNISSPFPLQAAVLSVAPPASAVPTRTKRGGKYVLPAPTESDVVMRNRISAQRSNDKRRRKMEAMKNEVAVLHDKVLPKLELQLESLKTENVHLRTKVKDLFDLPQLVSFY